MVKNKYVNIVIWQNDEPDKYGNMFSITESQTKEERESGQKAVYLGNLKASGKPKEQSLAQEVNSQNEIVSDNDGDDLPF